MTDAARQHIAQSHWRDEIGVPDGIPIGQQPSKPCDHNFQFLRNENVMRPDGVHPMGKCVGTQDVFYCRRCLEYREVKR